MNCCHAGLTNVKQRETNNWKDMDYLIFPVDAPKCSVTVKDDRTGIAIRFTLYWRRGRPMNSQNGGHTKTSVLSHGSIVIEFFGLQGPTFIRKPQAWTDKQAKQLEQVPAGKQKGRHGHIRSGSFPNNHLFSYKCYCITMMWPRPNICCIDCVTP